MCWSGERGSQGASWRKDFLEDYDGYDKDGKVSPLGKGQRRGEKWPEKWQAEREEGRLTEVWGRVLMLAFQRLDQEGVSAAQTWDD